MTRKAVSQFQYVLYVLIVEPQRCHYPSKIHAVLFRWHRSEPLEYDFVVRLHVSVIGNSPLFLLSCTLFAFVQLFTFLCACPPFLTSHSAPFLELSCIAVFKTVWSSSDKKNCLNLFPLLHSRLNLQQLCSLQWLRPYLQVEKLI